MSISRLNLKKTNNATPTPTLVEHCQQHQQVGVADPPVQLQKMTVGNNSRFRLRFVITKSMLLLALFVILASLLAACSDTDYQTVGQQLQASATPTTPVSVTPTPTPTPTPTVTTTTVTTAPTFTCNPSAPVNDPFQHFNCSGPTDLGQANPDRDFLVQFFTTNAQYTGAMGIGTITWLLQSAQTIRFNYNPDQRLCQASPGDSGLLIEPLTHCATQLFDVTKYAPVGLFGFFLLILIVRYPLSEFIPKLIGGFGWFEFGFSSFAVISAANFLDGLTTGAIDLSLRFFLWILNINQNTASTPDFGFDNVTIDPNIIQAINNVAGVFTVYDSLYKQNLELAIILSGLTFLTGLAVFLLGMFLLIRAIDLIISFILGPFALSAALVPGGVKFLFNWVFRFIMVCLSIVPIAVILKLAIVAYGSIDQTKFQSDIFQFSLVQITMMALFWVGVFICFWFYRFEVKTLPTLVRAGLAVSQSFFNGGRSSALMNTVPNYWVESYKALTGITNRLLKASDKASASSAVAKSSKSEVVSSGSQAVTSSINKRSAGVNGTNSNEEVVFTPTNRAATRSMLPAQALGGEENRTTLENAAMVAKFDNLSQELSSLTRTMTMLITTTNNHDRDINSFNRNFQTTRASYPASQYDYSSNNNRTIQQRTGYRGRAVNADPNNNNYAADDANNGDDEKQKSGSGIGGALRTAGTILKVGAVLGGGALAAGAISDLTHQTVIDGVTQGGGGFGLPFSPFGGKGLLGTTEEIHAVKAGARNGVSKGVGGSRMGGFYEPGQFGNSNTTSPTNANNSLAGGGGGNNNNQFNSNGFNTNSRYPNWRKSISNRNAAFVTGRSSTGTGAGTGVVLPGSRSVGKNPIGSTSNKSNFAVSNSGQTSNNNSNNNTLISSSANESISTTNAVTTSINNSNNNNDLSKQPPLAVSVKAEKERLKNRRQSVTNNGVGEDAGDVTKAAHSFEEIAGKITTSNDMAASGTPTNVAANAVNPQAQIAANSYHPSAPGAKPSTENGPENQAELGDKFSQSHGHNPNNDLNNIKTDSDGTFVVDPNPAPIDKAIGNFANTQTHSGITSINNVTNNSDSGNADGSTNSITKAGEVAALPLVEVAGATASLVRNSKNKKKDGNANGKKKASPKDNWERERQLRKNRPTLSPATGSKSIPQQPNNDNNSYGYAQSDDGNSAAPYYYPQGAAANNSNAVQSQPQQYFAQENTDNFTATNNNSNQPEENSNLQSSSPHPKEDRTAPIPLQASYSTRRNRAAAGRVTTMINPNTGQPVNLVSNNGNSTTNADKAVALSAGRPIKKVSKPADEKQNTAADDTSSSDSDTNKE